MNSSGRSHSNRRGQSKIYLLVGAVVMGVSVYLVFRSCRFDSATHHAGAPSGELESVEKGAGRPTLPETGGMSSGDTLAGGNAAVPLEREKKDISRKLYEGGRSFKHRVEDYATRYPWVAETYEKQKAASSRFSKLLADEKHREIEMWLTAGDVPQADSAAVKQERAEELDRVRKLYLSYEISRALDNPEKAPLVENWLGFRLKSMESRGIPDDSPGNNGAQLFTNPERVFPDPSTLEAFINRSNHSKEIFDTYVRENELDMIDARFPEGAEQHIENIVRTVLERDLAYFRLISNFPDLMKIHEQQENLKARKYHLAKEIQRFPQ